MDEDNHSDYNDGQYILIISETSSPYTQTTLPKKKKITTTKIVRDIYWPWEIKLLAKVGKVIFGGWRAPRMNNCRLNQDSLNTYYVIGVVFYHLPSLSH